MRRSAAGFTLLELLVVVGIFAIMSAMAYGGLNAVLSARRHIEDSLARTRDFQQTYTRLRDDMVNGSIRTIRDSDGTNQPGFYYDSSNRRPEFTRGGWSNPSGLPRSTEERVAYFLDDSDVSNRKLVRRSWRVLDRVSASQPVDMTLIEHVDKLSWRFLDTHGSWQDRWPGSDMPVGTSSCSLPVPVAVEASLSTADWGDFKLLFRYGADGANVLTTGTGTGTGATGIATNVGGASQLLPGQTAASAQVQGAGCQ